MRKDLVFCLVGLLMMITAAHVSSLPNRNFLLNILLVVFEPGGWFLVWIGMEQLINSSRRQSPEFEFYSKMTRSKIMFIDR